MSSKNSSENGERVFFLYVPMRIVINATIISIVKQVMSKVL